MGAHLAVTFHYLMFLHSIRISVQESKQSQPWMPFNGYMIHLRNLFCNFRLSITSKKSITRPSYLLIYLAKRRCMNRARPTCNHLQPSLSAHSLHCRIPSFLALQDEHPNHWWDLNKINFKQWIRWNWPSTMFSCGWRSSQLHSDFSVH